jgi:hypothetical protein
MKPDRGRLLAIAVEGTGLNKEDVASKAGYSRSAYYKHIENPNLDDHILIAYGRAMNYDFTELIPELPKYLKLDDSAKVNEQLLRERDYWKDKYVELLEKYNKMIEERL